jgi:hypothetical protein
MEASSLHNSCDPCGGAADDVVSFVVGDGTHTLYFSKQRLIQYTPFFKAYFTAHAAALIGVSSEFKNTSNNGNMVVLKHVTAAAAEAALRLCHSRHHDDDEAFWTLQRACATAPQRRGALRDVLSLYETCVKFELHRHAHAVAKTVETAVTPITVLDVLRTCARYTSALPKDIRLKIGLQSLLAACRPCIPAAWTCDHDERRWRRLCAAYPELPAMLEAAAAVAVNDDAAVKHDASGDGRGGIPRHLLSPLIDYAVPEPNGSGNDVAPQSDRQRKHHHHRHQHQEQQQSSAAVVTTETTLEDVFMHHLQQTEALALAAQRRRSAIEADVVALRACGAALRARVSEDEAAAAASTRYLADTRVYVQALRAAGEDMRALCTTLVAAPADAATLPATSALHALRHQLERATELAVERRSSVDELLAVEEEALRRLDDELAELQRKSCSSR